MLYDPEDYDTALLVTGPSRQPLAPSTTAAATLGSSEFRGMLEREGWLGAMQPSAASGEYRFQFFNGYQVRVQERGQQYHIALIQANQLSRAGLSLNAMQLTGFLRRVEALPAPDSSLLGEF